MITRDFDPYVTDLRLAAALLTRLPLPHLPDSAFAQQSRAVWAYPIAGIVVGALGALVGALAMGVGLPSQVAAGLVLVVLIMTTGAMHEDGIADSADGLWGGWTVERRLEIMKDSRIGAYGVIALILSLGLRWAALSIVLAVSPWAVIAVAAGSRAVMPMLMITMPNARASGLSQSVGQPNLTRALIGLAVGAVAMIVFAGWSALPAAIIAAAAVVGFAAIALAKIGGQTGDILGASQQVAEIAMLLVLSAVLA